MTGALRREITLVTRRLRRLPKLTLSRGQGRGPMRAINASVKEGTHPAEKATSWVAEVRGQTGYGSIGMDGELGYEGLHVTLPGDWPRYETISAHAPSGLRPVGEHFRGRKTAAPLKPDEKPTPAALRVFNRFQSYDHHQLVQGNSPPCLAVKVVEGVLQGLRFGQEFRGWRRLLHRLVMPRLPLSDTL